MGYDRDIGVALHGRLGRGAYIVGVYNGSGPNQVNDNVDFMEVARIEFGLVGDLPDSYFEHDYAFGDASGHGQPALTVGVSASHDLVALPDRVAGIEVGQPDVDGSGEPDNVRVFSGSADLLFRWRGLEVFVETLLRQERWGTILDHSQNEVLRNQIGAGADGVRHYGVISSHVGYFVLPHHLLIGGGVAIGSVPLLSLGGRNVFAQTPPGDRQLDVDTTVTWYGDERGRSLGLTYRLSKFSGLQGRDAPTQHSVVLEGLFRL
jgi:hypothetical protein